MKCYYCLSIRHLCWKTFPINYESNSLIRMILHGWHACFFMVSKKRNIIPNNWIWMYRNFYNLLELWLFLWTFSFVSHMEWWNSGMLAPVKCKKKISRGKNTGYKKRKTKSFLINVESTLLDDARQTSIFCFNPKRTPSKLNHQCKNMRFDFFFKPIIPQ